MERSCRFTRSFAGAAYARPVSDTAPTAENTDREVSMHARTLPTTEHARVAAPPPRVPMTAAAFRHLGGEVARLAGRLGALKRVLEAAQVVEPDGRAVLGTRVALRFADGEVERFELVAPAEADPAGGRLSHESPVGAAVLGRRPGDTFSLVAPAGLQVLMLLGVAEA